MASRVREAGMNVVCKLAALEASTARNSSSAGQEPITGSASALVEQEGVLDPGAQRELAQAIQEEADRLNRLVHNLLEMTRLESGGIHVRKDWEPLEEVIGSALSRVEKPLGERRVDVRLPPDLPLVPLDPLLIEQVLINFLHNAIEAVAATPNPRIELSCTAGIGQISIAVTDNGRGLDEAIVERIFVPFFSTKPGGSGIGLSLARQIALAHHGQVIAERRAAGGAVFTLSLPAGAH